MPSLDKLQNLFERAVALSPTARADFLDRACAGDAELRRQVEALLRADDVNRADGGGEPDIGLRLAGDEALLGTLIEDWRLKERIGTGGMGTVFLAERHVDDFTQQAALKIVKKGMDSEQVLRRFRQERSILARLSHPNIASLLDGGMTDDGRPWFAMEYVDGVPITAYCDAQQLDIDARLALFETVCDAVHHAHRSLVVHRDLKPSNILVAVNGVPKLLDFGIAKLLDDDGGELLTRTGVQVHTPAYAAPEQFRNEAITTATDVYALGVVLYELLAGRRPFEVRRTPEELRESVLTGDPPKPSTAVTQLPATADGGHDIRTLSHPPHRTGLSAERLKRRLRGDLDTICLMALHREPGHRYTSADQMATDIRRHLDGLPVLATPDSLGYRAKKFLQRHRRGVIATAAVVTAFVALTAYYTMQLARERDIAVDEQRKAAEVVDFVTGLFAVADPSESRGAEVTARELLEAGAERIGTELAEQPTVRATMQRVLGEVHYSLGSRERAYQLLTGALEQQQRLYGDRHPETATTKLTLAFLHQDDGNYERAEALFRDVLETRTAIHGREHPAVLEALSAIGAFEEVTSNFDAAETAFIDALALARSLADGDDAAVAEAMKNLAGLYRILDRNDDAEPLLRDALAMQQRLYGGPHPETDDTKRQLAGLLRNTRRYEESEALYLEVIESRTRMLGPDHLEVAHTWNSYSQMLADDDRLQQALDANQAFIDIMERAYAGPHPSLGAAYNNRATLLDDLGDLDASVEWFDRSIEMQDRTGLPERHVNRSFPLANKAFVLNKLGQYADAEAILRDMLELRREHFDEDHVLISELKNELGAALTGLGRYDEAERLLVEVRERYLESLGPDDPRTERVLLYLGELRQARGETPAGGQ